MAGAITVIIFNRNVLSSIFLVTLSFLAWPSNIRAQGTVLDAQASGKIIELKRNAINVGDLTFELSPTVKVTGYGRTTLKHLHKGDYVGVKLLKFNGRLLVDTIYYLKNEPEGRYLLLPKE